ncbi:MAG: lysozyme subfamily 2 [Circular genetic element sp.]|nr:MAG: lysozyme subfamily 2 [Circular genetic element sp.]
MQITNENEVFLFAEQNNISDIYALTLFAQAKHETGNFTSNVFKNAINSFGMRVAQKRPQNKVGTLTTAQGNYAVFSNYVDSWRDRISLDFYNKTLPPTSLEDVPRYIQEVANKGYATDPIYAQKWLNTASSVLSSVGVSPAVTSKFSVSWGSKLGIVGVVVLAIVGYLIASKKIKLPFKIPFLT